MYHIRPNSLRTEDPHYTRLSTQGTFVVPMARVAIDYATSGFYEQHIVDWSILKYVSSEKCVVDVGAHIGMYTVPYARVAHHVYSFECSPKSFNYLCANIALNDLNYNVTKHNVALGAHIGTGTYCIRDPVEGGGNGIYLGEGDAHVEKLEVPLRTLDSFNLNNIGLIKMDVEGYELQVLKGATETLKLNAYPPILFESCRPETPDTVMRRQELFAFISSLGYTIQPVPGWGWGDMFIATG